MEYWLTLIHIMSGFWCFYGFTWSLSLVQEGTVTGTEVWSLCCRLFNDSSLLFSLWHLPSWGPAYWCVILSPISCCYLSISCSLCICIHTSTHNAHVVRCVVSTWAFIWMTPLVSYIYLCCFHTGIYGWRRLWAVIYYLRPHGPLREVPLTSYCDRTGIHMNGAACELLLIL